MFSEKTTSVSKVTGRTGWGASAACTAVGRAVGLGCKAALGPCGKLETAAVALLLEGAEPWSAGPCECWKPGWG